MDRGFGQIKHQLVVGISLGLAALSGWAQEMPSDMLQKIKTDFGEIERDLYTLTVPAEGLYLNSPGAITADTIILEGPLVTNGHPLMIDAQRIEVGRQGKIVTFSADPPAPPAISQVAPAGTAGEGLTGINGNPGGPGAEGLPGAPGIDGCPHAGDITIFAQEIIGKLVIDARGQNGGIGGEGGRGGPGGIGARGASAVSGKRGGGRGGDGGPGGIGGPGGRGGNGGPAANVYLYVVKTAVAVDPPVEVLQTPGRGALGGVFGLYGVGGAPGRGGHGDSYRKQVRKLRNLFGLFHEYVERSWPAGPDGTRPTWPQERPSGRGLVGDDYAGPPAIFETKDLSALAMAQQKVEQALVDFHWERLLIDLMIYSADLVAEEQALQGPWGQNAVFEGPWGAEYFHNPAKLAATWQKHFIRPLEKVRTWQSGRGENNPLIKNALTKATAFSRLMQDKGSSADELKALHQYVQREARIFSHRLLDVYNACVAYLAQKEQAQVAFRMFHIPACDDLTMIDPTTQTAADLVMTLPLVFRDARLKYAGDWRAAAGEQAPMVALADLAAPQAFTSSPQFWRDAEADEGTLELRPVTTIVENKDRALRTAVDMLGLAQGPHVLLSLGLGESSPPRYHLPAPDNQFEIYGFYGTDRVNHQRLSLDGQLQALVQVSALGFTPQVLGAWRGED